jgi:hypothetical protein
VFELVRKLAEVELIQVVDLNSSKVLGVVGNVFGMAAWIQLEACTEDLCDEDLRL